MSKLRIIPRLALGGLRRNSTVYVPYIFASSLCTFVFYIFASIQQNKLMESLPHASYIKAQMIIDEVLLAKILTPFLININNYLIKQRKTELGLYSVLGMEKKHIGLMLFIESVALYVISMALGVIIATVFSKFIFMFLLKITHISADTQFSFSLPAFTITLIYFGVISIINLIINLRQVSVSSPTELFSSAKQGEKDPKHLWLSTLAGVISLGAGFTIALRSEINSMVFTDFFLAVALVVFGTHLLFKSISVSFLKACRNNKKYYYKSRNFVTVSGMLYRMKKNSSGLANICVFCTMTIITLLCTVSVFLGEKDAIDFAYPYTCKYYFNADSFDSADEFTSSIKEKAYLDDVDVSGLIDFTYQKFMVSDLNGNVWEKCSEEGWNQEVKAIPVDEYNRTQNKNETLAEDEILIFTADANYGLDSVVLGDKTFRVKKELTEISFCSKNERYMGSPNYLMVFANPEIISEIAADGYETDGASNNRIHVFFFNVSGENGRAYVGELDETAKTLGGFNLAENKYDWEDDSYAITGGLLFIGVFFGLVFLICMVLMMYYKQISEGYEDKRNFEIMQKVGMTDKEVKATISKQILTVFFMPLVTSVIYTGIALNIVCNLLSTLQIFSIPLIVLSAAGTVILFALVYLISYNVTAKAYYKIVK